MIIFFYYYYYIKTFQRRPKQEVKFILNLLSLHPHLLVEINTLINYIKLAKTITLVEYLIHMVPIKNHCRNYF